MPSHRRRVRHSHSYESPGAAGCGSQAGDERPECLTSSRGSGRLCFEATVPVASAPEVPGMTEGGARGMPKAGTPAKMKITDKAAARTSRTAISPASSLEGPSRAFTISHEEIATRAFALFLARGGQHGDDLADWYHAEAELQGERWRASLPREIARGAKVSEEQAG